MRPDHGPAPRPKMIDHSIVQRPLNPRSRTAHRPQRTPGLHLEAPIIRLKSSAQWLKWHEVTIRLSGIHTRETTYSLWENFAGEGEIVFIELFEGRDGKRDGNAKIIFSPAPSRCFWRSNFYQLTVHGGGKYNVKVSLDDRGRGPLFQSPIKKYKFYEPVMKLSVSSLDFGLMVSPHSMMPLQRVNSTPTEDVTFMVDLKRSRIQVSFKVHFRDPRIRDPEIFRDDAIGPLDRTNSYMFQIPFGQLRTIQQTTIGGDAFGLIISVESPPRYFRKRESKLAGHGQENPTWSELDTWYRQTDIVYDPYRLQTAQVALHKEQPEIDIGRWTTYAFTFKKASNDSNVYKNIVEALQDYNIAIVPTEGITTVPSRPAELWSRSSQSISGYVSISFTALQTNEIAETLPFEVRYQLEVCISRRFLDEHNITREFVKSLSDIATKDPAKARNLLEYIAEQGKREYDPMTIFQDPDALAFSPITDIPHYCAYVRKATITPSTMYFSSPTVETTNRVLRRYARENQEGRFLRVQFTDELFEGRINACADKQLNDELFTRVYRTLFNGIQIGDRLYEFLAFGNSQFRENGAYFFCPTDHLSCDDIRAWMGNFTHIQVVAKYAARLGQCFSTTRAINGISNPKVIKIEDVERGTYCFTDGVGKISPFMAQMIAAELGIRGNTAPSAFQFRLGGCKGVIAVWSDVKLKEIHIRPSQHKFAAIYNGLEIIRCARFSAATLNRQTITILSSLGVPDGVFITMLSEQLARYQSAMDNDDLAVELLCKWIDDTQMTVNIATMIRNGFMAGREPFVISLLHLWRSWSVKNLKEKAKIIVEKGAFVLGCIDETDTLRGYTRPVGVHGDQLPVEQLPQIFIQVPDTADPDRYNVIEGVCLVGRNPSLHPGDLRVVKAIDVPALHHLRDVVVFPRNGTRDIPSMCSGGDLDGDDFFVLWDANLQPQEWNCEPMNYDAPNPKKQFRPVEITDLMKFFVRFMKNDALPTIAHAHMAQSDYLDSSVKDSKCIELARLHSKAVDYVKTGQPAELPKRLQPRKWPHFMEKKFKRKDQQYHSEKILGQLYDRVESVDFVPQWEQPFDKRILRAYKLDDSLLKSVRQIKSQYDTAMKRILANQDIKTEFEVWSTFVLSKPRVGSDYKQQEDIARISDALKDQFRAVCVAKAGGKDFFTLAPFVAGMYKVTKEELDIALAECRTTKFVGGREVPKRKMESKSMPLITFPWLFEKELGRIATGIDTSDNHEDLGILPSVFKKDMPTRKRQTGGEAASDDYVFVQDNGAKIHHGEELDLFRPDNDDLSEDADYDKAQSAGYDYSNINGEAGNATLSENFSTSANPKCSGGTGVEDVVPLTELDGFVNPQNSERPVHQATPFPKVHVRATCQFEPPSSIFVGQQTRMAHSTSIGKSKAIHQLNFNATSHSRGAQSRDSNGSVNSRIPSAIDSLEPGEIINLGNKHCVQDKSIQDVKGYVSITEPRTDTEEVEVELVAFQSAESSLEKLARLMEVDEKRESLENSSKETEEVVLEMVDQESALEKLDRMMIS